VTTQSTFAIIPKNVFSFCESITCHIAKFLVGSKQQPFFMARSTTTRPRNLCSYNTPHLFA